MSNKSERKSVRQRGAELRAAVVESLLTGGISLRGTRNESGLREALRGRTVLVTGASSGIGRATAHKAAQAGALAVLVARSELALRSLQEEIKAAGGSARVYACDLSSRANIELLLSRLAHDQLDIDVLINNAGRSIRRSVLDSCTRPHDYERTMALNYFGSLRLTLGLLPGMQARGRGHVIHVSSAGVPVGTPLFSAYVASKAALDAFSRVAAAELRSAGVRFSTVHMPLVRTPMIAPTAAYRHLRALSPEQAAEIVLRPIATGERHLATATARLIGLAHQLAPDLTESVLSLGHLLQRESDNADVARLAWAERGSEAAKVA